jgi:hypothetical protein
VRVRPTDAVPYSGGDRAPRSALSTAATVECGHQRSSRVANGSDKPQVIAPTAHAAEIIQAGDGPEGQRSAPSGSRRAASGVCNNRRVCSETVEDHDRRFWHRWPLTWRSSHAFTVLNTTQFHVRRPSADLARRKRGVQIPSPPPHKNPGHEPGGSLPLADAVRDLPQRASGHFPSTRGMTVVFKLPIDRI